MITLVPILAAVLYNELLKRSIDARFINTSAAKNESNQGKFSLKKIFSFLHVYRSTLFVGKYDVVYMTPGQTFFGVVKYAPFIFSCLYLKKPFIIHVHGNHFGSEYKSLTGFKKKMFKSLVTKARAGIVLSHSLRHNFESLLDNERTYVVPNFVEDSLFAVDAPKQTDKLRILFLSNLMEEKGVFDLLDALRKLKDKGILFEAVFAGSVESSLAGRLDSLFSSLGDNVKYIGTISGEDKRQRLLDANVLILPTYYKMEGQPIALLEGMATGNIIISTRHAGIPDIVSELNGFLVPPKSSAHICACLERLSTDLPKMIQKYANTNKAYAQQNFTVDAFTNNILQVLNASTKT
ncbi:glycosyltransferase family 4 protein [Segetibacter sp. 3557_3]|uniref:glycosyltransferase family 4 protein n=1 Tax=Segetibacter sp. 3557_3 TaxID=2547429 RepID=UPI0014050139|nr:glycosyltransferase family 4 protein [Segetibacter sp. 3557_3]